MVPSPGVGSWMICPTAAMTAGLDGPTWQLRCWETPLSRTPLVSFWDCCASWPRRDGQEACVLFPRDPPSDFIQHVARAIGLSPQIIVIVRVDGADDALVSHDVDAEILQRGDLARIVGHQFDFAKSQQCEHRACDRISPF